MSESLPDELVPPDLWIWVLHDPGKRPGKVRDSRSRMPPVHHDGDLSLAIVESTLHAELGYDGRDEDAWSVRTSASLAEVQARAGLPDRTVREKLRVLVERGQATRVARGAYSASPERVVLLRKEHLGRSACFLSGRTRRRLDQARRTTRPVGISFPLLACVAGRLFACQMKRAEGELFAPSKRRLARELGCDPDTIRLAQKWLRGVEIIRLGGYLHGQKRGARYPVYRIGGSAQRQDFGTDPAPSNGVDPDPNEANGTDPVPNECNEGSNHPTTTPTPSAKPPSPSATDDAGGAWDGGVLRGPWPRRKGGASLSVARYEAKARELLRGGESIELVRRYCGGHLSDEWLASEAARASPPRPARCIVAPVRVRARGLVSPRRSAGGSA